MGMNVHIDLDARAHDPWSPAQAVHAVEPTYNGRTRARLVELLGENGADNYISFRRPDAIVLEDLDEQGERNEVENVLNVAGVPRASKDGTIISLPERVRILAAWAQRSR